MKIGFIGLGNLGMPIAENLLMQQHTLYVYNRTAAKAQPLVEKGAVICSSIKELAATCEVVFTIVSDDAALRHIVEGPEGLAANLAPGAIHICMSTILPETAVDMQAIHQQHQNHYISAPLMGRPEAARQRKLNFLVSGDGEVIAKIKPLFESAGAANVWEFGADIKAGPTAKLCSNYLILSGIAALAEGIQLANQSGLDTTQWMQMLTQTLFNAPFYQNYSRIFLQERFFPAGFSMRMGLKDANLIMQLATTADANMPVGKQVQTLIQEAIANGLGDHDVTAIALQLKN